MRGQNAEAVGSPMLIHHVAAVTSPRASGDRLAAGVCQQASRPAAACLVRPAVGQRRQLVTHHRKGRLPDCGIVPALRCPPEDGVHRIIEGRGRLLLDAGDKGLGQALAHRPDLNWFGRAVAQASGLRDVYKFPGAQAPATAARFANDKMGGNAHRLKRGRRALDLAQQVLHCSITHLKQRHGHAGQRRLLHRALRPVIEADEGDILRHPQPGRGQRLHGTQSRLVVAGQDRGKRRGGGQDLLHCSVAAGRDVPAVGDEPLVRRQRKLLERSPIRVEARARVAGHILRAARNERDPFMSMCNKMLHGLADARGIVRDDGRTGLSGCNKYDWMPGGDQRLKLV